MGINISHEMDEMRGQWASLQASSHQHDYLLTKAEVRDLRLRMADAESILSGLNHELQSQKKYEDLEQQLGDHMTQLAEDFAKKLAKEVAALKAEMSKTVQGVSALEDAVTTQKKWTDIMKRDINDLRLNLPELEPRELQSTSQDHDRLTALEDQLAAVQKGLKGCEVQAIAQATAKAKIDLPESTWSTSATRSRSMPRPSSTSSTQSKPTLHFDKPEHPQDEASKAITLEVEEKLFAAKYAGLPLEERKRLLKEVNLRWGPVFL